jgi:hypothetical protein
MEERKFHICHYIITYFFFRVWSLQAANLPVYICNVSPALFKFEIFLGLGGNYTICWDVEDQLQPVLEHEDTKLVKTAGFWIFELAFRFVLIRFTNYSFSFRYLIYFDCIVSGPPSLTLWLIVPRG